MAEDLLMEDETQDSNTGQMTAISANDTQAQQVKPPTLNTMIVGRLDSLEGTIAFLADTATIKMLAIMALVIGCLCLAGIVYLITEVSFLLGRLTP